MGRPPVGYPCPLRLGVAVGYQKVIAAAARARPSSCASTNPGTEAGEIPAKVLVNARPMVTAGFANEVDEVNQYAAPI